MTAAAVEVLGPFAAAPPEQGDGQLAGTVAEADAAAARNAAARLAGWLPGEVVDQLGAYFVAAGVARAEAAPAALRFSLDEFLVRLCATPRAVQGAGAGAASELELRTHEGPVDGSEYGERPEPESARMLFSPARLEAALADGLSLGLRQFDRQFPEWAPVVDDIATVAQADVFTKLFVTGGKESVTDWHRDQSDVVATMLSGRKRFEVAPAQARDGEPPETEVGADLKPGVALLLPRSRLHCATPLGETGVLLSIGIMRQADWSFRSVAPTHLGLDSPPRSVRAYRLALRPHLPAAPAPRGWAAKRRWRSRLPGGIAVLAEGGRPELLAQGRRIGVSEAALAALLAVHAEGVASSAQVAAAVGAAEEKCAELLASLCRAELVAPLADSALS